MKTNRTSKEENGKWKMRISCKIKRVGILVGALSIATSCWALTLIGTVNPLTKYGTGDQRLPEIVRDGNLNTYMAWTDTSWNAPRYEKIYVQKFNITGQLQWGANIAVSSMTGRQLTPKLVYDGNGGVIVTWTDYTSGPLQGKIYAQKINKDGSLAWGDGRLVADRPGWNDHDPKLTTPDAQGNVYIVWESKQYNVTKPHDLVLVQSLDSTAGQRKWKPGGEYITPWTDDDQFNPQIISDGYGGAIVVYELFHKYNGIGIYTITAQRIRSSNNIIAYYWGWSFGSALGMLITENSPANGVGLYRRNPAIAADGRGGFIIAWERYSSDKKDADIYATKIVLDPDYKNIDAIIPAIWAGDGKARSSHDVDLEASGIAICNKPGLQQNPMLVGDGYGSMYFAWDDFRDATHSDIYYDELDANAKPRIGNGGQAICNIARPQGLLDMTPAGNGGTVLTWADVVDINHWNLRAQYVDGVPQWAANGVQVCGAPNRPFSARVVADPFFAYLVWEDYRDGSQFDIYAQTLSLANASPQWPWASNLKQNGLLIVR